MATKAEYQQRLEEAEAAMHRLATGSAVETVVSPGGDSVKFMATDLAKLETYIGFLKRQIAAAEGRYGTPIHFGFSKTR